MLTYEMACRPDQIGMKKAWLTWHSQDLEDFRLHLPQMVEQDEVVPGAYAGFFQGLTQDFSWGWGTSLFFDQQNQQRGVSSIKKFSRGLGWTLNPPLGCPSGYHQLDFSGRSSPHSRLLPRLGDPGRQRGLFFGSIVTLRIFSVGDETTRQFASRRRLSSTFQSTGHSTDLLDVWFRRRVALLIAQTASMNKFVADTSHVLGQIGTAVCRFRIGTGL